MIIFNDGISKFYQCSIWGICRGISMFFSICLDKKNAEVIKFWGMLKKYVSKNKINLFFLRKKGIFLLNKKVIFVFDTIFKLDSITQIIYSITQRWLCFQFVLLFSLVSVCKKWNIETMLTFPYSYNWQKLATTKWMKKEARSIRVGTLNM